jgi:hypothetical protein
MRLALLWGRGTLSMFAVIAGGLVLGLLGAPAIVTAGTSGAPHPAGSPQSDLGRELPSLRTASSDTYERGGLRVLKAYTHPVNYRDGAGKWQPIEDSLVQAEGGGWRTKASGVPVSLPATLTGGAVSIGSGDQIVSLTLQGAGSSAASVFGTTGSYQSVLPSTSASYAAGGTSVRETLTLADAQAPTTYRYTLGLSPGLHATLTQAGTVEIADGSGHTIYRLAAPGRRGRRG